MMEDAVVGKYSAVLPCSYLYHDTRKEKEDSPKVEQIPLIIVCVESNGIGKEVKGQSVSNIFHELFLFRWILSAGPEL